MLNQDFYFQPTALVAQQLIGKRLVSRIGRFKTSGIIVETEAYLSADDPACHGTRGRTKSNASMFGPAGRAYVYPIHAGFCFNVVTKTSGVAEAVLVRALQPDTGLQRMVERRGRDGKRELTTGPSRLCQALAINRKQDGHDLTLGKSLWIEELDKDHSTQFSIVDIISTERIGVTSGQDLELRFAWANNDFVSGPKRMRMKK